VPRFASPDLVDQNFIYFPRNMRVGIYDQFIELCCKRGFLPKIVPEVEEATTILGLVATGLGVANVASGLRYIRSRTSNLCRLRTTMPRRT
jgi:DNA-binding transcriptional LysR family regulator